MSRFKVGNAWIGDSEPTYFIADISANHDGVLERAKQLIHLSAEAGADAVKFQNFRASKIVSRSGFESIGKQLSHQAKWKKSVFQVYEEASLPWEWTKDLKVESDKAGIEYFSTPYDLEAVDMLDPYVSFFKIGSGDITWPQMLTHVASRHKPVILATGAADLEEVERAMSIITSTNKEVVLMQCNTNYTASPDNFRHIHLNVLKTFRRKFPHVVLGLSDHTRGQATVLGAVALGARVIEKHFTDDNNRDGPDHHFSMMPHEWKDMVDRTRELENALGIFDKHLADNEKETVIVQRRCLRAAKDIKAGSILISEMIAPLRPAPKDGIFPYELDKIVGKRLCVYLREGEYFRWEMLE